MKAPSHPLKVAIIGAGAAGLYATTELLRRDACARVDLFDRLPTPGGLVRSGVSPDHAARREVSAVLERMAVASGRFRYFGNVAYGRELTLDDLRRHYHATIFACGAVEDRRLGIPGEDLPGSHAATHFVGWYNAHPDQAERRFDFDCERAAVIGNGNVALDVARMMLLPIDLLRQTDIADHALDALSTSRVREVVILGRRGPAQASFTAPELLELTHLPGVAVEIDGVIPDDVPASLPASQRLRLQILHELRWRRSAPAPRRLILRFQRSAEALLGEDRVVAVRLVENRLVDDGRGGIKAEPGSTVETLEVGLVFRSIGYRASALPRLPFDDSRGVIPNQAGRVQGEDGLVQGLYVTGWIKRGPNGVIGSNRFCARETVDALMADAGSLKARPPMDLHNDLPGSLQRRGIGITDHRGWQQIDRIERERGLASGRPRRRIAARRELLAIAASGPA
ncbi:FAD-dependent oxidoreductase [Sinimarinibacterium thermocellulolyticum]|uniref:FAD-dependent oxidoreductase n=1 Tax=Sinimarinibacterium thermocellulolyticum TaxID=3170016 RepID=A0ABV2ADQ9_9GAMM